MDLIRKSLREVDERKLIEKLFSNLSESYLMKLKYQEGIYEQVLSLTSDPTEKEAFALDLRFNETDPERSASLSKLSSTILGE